MTEGLRPEEVRAAAEVALDFAKKDDAHEAVIGFLERLSGASTPEVIQGGQILAELLASLMYAQHELKKDEHRIMSATMKKRGEMN